MLLLELDDEFAEPLAGHGGYSCLDAGQGELGKQWYLKEALQIN